MFDSGAPYRHLKGVLDDEDLDFLKRGCREVLERERVPCYSLIDRLQSKTVNRIKVALEADLGEELFYLNDFYIYTDSTFRTQWHMDTELFTFDRAVNAWILLHPEEVEDPLGFIDGLNGSPESFFHSVASEKEAFVFSEYHRGRRMTCTASEIEARHVHTPLIRKGDILALDPSHFHKTNVSSPKHAISIKFLLKGERGFLSPRQVRPALWPEVKTFNSLVKGTTDWSQVIAGLRSALKTEEGRKSLSSGFYPEQFGLYLERVRSI